MKPSSPLRVALLALLLVGLGFALGFGYQTLQHADQRSGPVNGADGDEPARPPVVRGLRLSPDNRVLAFTAIYHSAEQAGRFLFDLQTYLWSEAKSPEGWQDAITQWSSDGKRILFARERIPRTSGGGATGLYEEAVALPKASEQRQEPEALSSGAEPPGERAYAGFWTPDGRLVMKTRRETKGLFLKQDDSAVPIDQSPGTYYQNRAVQENGTLAYYVVRDISPTDSTVGLFRIHNGQSRQIGETLTDIVWAYITENARWMVVCYYAANGSDWQWSLYAVTPSGMQLQRQAEVPADVIAVYWSPDFRRILGAAGKSLWLIEVPSLQVRQVGTREDWNADDATWLGEENKAVVAAAGQLWRVDVETGQRSEMWKFPQEYWK